jgi:hypothetical protein
MWRRPITGSAFSTSTISRSQLLLEVERLLDQPKGNQAKAVNDQDDRARS